MLTPLRPARPVRAGTVLQNLGIVRNIGVDDKIEVRQVDAARRHVVATQTRARPSRKACNAWVRSFCVNSPESATTEKPRSR